MAVLHSPPIAPIQGTDPPEQPPARPALWTLRADNTTALAPLLKNTTTWAGIREADLPYMQALDEDRVVGARESWAPPVAADGQRCSFSSSRLSLSVGSTITVPATGQLTVGA